MTFDFSRLLTLSYFFERNPGGDFLPGFFLLAFFILVMFSGTFMRKYAADNKYLRKSIRKKFWMFPVLGVLGVISVLSRFAAVPFFSMRAWLYGILVVTLALLLIVLLKVSREYRKRLRSVAREREKRGY